jgi:excinuclease ABC subunit A
MKSITINNARIHNLKNIDVTIPKGKLVVVTGISGSGKSSLVFDIVFEEGRRQYLQSLGVLSGISEEDAFDHIAGIGPTVAVQQGIIRQSNPRSVVGTKTKILSYLGTLYAHEGDVTCSSCGVTVGKNMICEQCGNMEEKLTTSYFSFNSLSGMCMQCEGRGAYFELNMEKLIPEPTTTLSQMLNNANALSSFQHLLKGLFKEYKDTPFYEIPEEARNHVLYGKILGNHLGNRRSHCLFEHLKGQLLKGREVDGTIDMMVCPECHGYRIGEEARRVTLNQKHIGELGHMTISELQSFLKNLSTQDHFSPYGHNLVKAILQKTYHLIHVGLGHLTLYREMPTLSGGEIQRLFLVSHLDSQMDSLIYILDEPTIGLHEIEKVDLLKQIMALKALGNTIIIVEHDRNTIEKAEHILDFGPLAGADGGEIVYQGDFEELLNSERSLTGQYLSGKRAVPRKTLQDYARITETIPKLKIHHVSTNNLKDLTVEFPLGVLVGVAGVSGSGKSSLIADTLVPLLKRHFVDVRERKRNDKDENDSPPLVGGVRGGRTSSPPPNLPHQGGGMLKSTVLPLPPQGSNGGVRLEGTEHLAGYAEVSQAPIGRRHNSHPASYINIWDKLRKLFAQQPIARERGYSPGHFSFNSKGACPDCSGSGYKKLWLGGNFFVSHCCTTCHGKRYREGILDVTYQSKNILDVLNMSVAKAAEFFKDIRSIHSMLNVLERTGMSYITLGQPAPTLSGGEAQRIKLAKEIGRRRKGNILYILDEPTTGLSFYDIARLLVLLGELVKQGNSVLVIEHDPSVLSYCDWIIELGPGGGHEGGEIITQGSPMDLMKNPKSRIGPFLMRNYEKRLLAHR